MQNNDIKTKFIELRAKGNSLNNIADTLGVSKQTLINWSKDLQIEISNFKAFEYDELVNKYQIGKEYKLKSYKTMLNKLEAELEKRDLTDVKTDKLLEIYLKTYDSLTKEVTPISLIGDGSWELQPTLNSWTA